MPTLLVIDRDDTFLPRGWVSAILPDGAEPTEYEKSGKLWRVVSVPVGPETSPCPGSDPLFFKARALIQGGGKIVSHNSPAGLIAMHIDANAGSIKPVPGPARLDRSHSTVWDYGAGRTYSTPQAAFDALLAQVGPGGFTETHYLRGFGGTFGQGPSGAALSLSTVSPSKRHPLVIDAEAGTEVVFDNQLGDYGLISDLVDHVRVRDLKFIRANAAIVPAESYCRDWVIERCEIDGSGSSMVLGVSLLNVHGLAVINCRIHGAAWGIGGYPGLADDYATRVIIRGCKIDGFYQAIWNNAPVSFVLANNVLRANHYGIKHEGANPLNLTVMINNIFAPLDAGFTCIHAADLAAGDLEVLHSEANCFHAGNGFTAHVAGIDMDLEDWRDATGGDQFSIGADPNLDSGLTPRRGSPCLGRGAGLDRRGWSGKARAASIDIGAEQVTDPFIPGVHSRRAPEIARRK